MRHPRFAPLPALALLAACATQAPPEGPALPPAPLPAFSPGEQVSWSNGATETVVAVEGEVVRWRDQNGNTFSGYRNFALPSLTWSYPNSRATTEVAVPPSTLWPLEVGKRAHFTVVQTQTAFDTSRSTYSMEWECRVDATETVQVALGRFDTFRLRCSRYWRGSNVGEVSWSYAPSLGRVIKRTWTGAKAPEELVAIGTGPLDPRAEKVAAKVRTKALDAAESGARARGAVEGVMAVVTPTATFATSSGSYCRDFLQRVNTARASAVTAGTACRSPKGEWLVVDRLPDAD
jgi:hypothetical protein